MSAVLGITEVDAVGAILGTGMMRFQSPAGIDGLAKEDGDRIDILAVVANDEGKGQFTQFIEGCKAQYAHIRVWEIMNPKVAEKLKRFGFVPVEETITLNDGMSEKVKGWGWDEKA